MPRKTQTRQRLLEAAIEVISTEGEAGIRVGEIADAAHVTKPSVYHFFGDRDGLITAALAEMYLRTLLFRHEELLDAARRTETAAAYHELAERVVRSFFTEAGRSRRALRARVLGAAVDRPRLQAALVDMHRTATAVVVEFAEIGREKGYTRFRSTPGIAALFTITAVAGRHYAEIDPDIDLAEWDELVVTLIRYVLFDQVESAPQPN